MSDHDTRVTPWRVCDDVREAAVSGDKHCIPILSRSEDFLVWTSTQADIPHIEGIMSCRAQYPRQRSRQILVDEKPHRQGRA